MSKAALIVTVWVHVRLAGRPKVEGSSERELLINEKYNEVTFADNAVAVLHKAEAAMQVKWAEKKAFDGRQGKLFQETV